MNFNLTNFFFNSNKISENLPQGERRKRKPLGLNHASFFKDKKLIKEKWFSHLNVLS